MTGNINTGETLKVTSGIMRLKGGTRTGNAADAAALIFSGGEAKVTAPSLILEGGSGPFFPPFDTGVFSPDSDLFHFIGDNTLVRLLGSAYPITVTGSVTRISNPLLAPAFFISEAPPLNLDSLLAAFIKTTDCASFSGGSCTLSEATAANAGKAVKGGAGGICK